MGCHIKTRATYNMRAFNPIQGGGAKTPVLRILAISQSFQVRLKWYQKQMWNQHSEAPFAKILKIGLVIAIFVCLTNIQKRVKKNQERAFFGHFLTGPKKSYSIQIFKSGQNIVSLLKRNIQIPPPLSTDWHPFL